MFLVKQSKSQISQYTKFLKIAGSLSNLFSDSAVPYLYYRVAEKIFCKAFGAEDLSRGDLSADAKKGSLGIGLKTFLAGNSKSFQKIAEFNSDRPIYLGLSPENMILKIAELRNARIIFTNRAHLLNNGIYHCVVRDKSKFYIYEERMDTIDISKISKISKNDSSLKFSDGKNEYSFLLSKSTLTKKFITSPIVYEIDIEILKDPFKDLSKLFGDDQLIFADEKIIQTIYLPLYGSNKTVYPSSGLNQWNAKGRPRNEDEAYIPIPADVKLKYPDFFPNRDSTFNIKLPNGKTITAKICQSGDKALMSQSNKELGHWILRDLLKIPAGQLVTYSQLQTVGVDSVRIDKINDTEFELNFANLDSFENFRINYL
jgi:hypothetical protein